MENDKHDHEHASTETSNNHTDHEKHTMDENDQSRTQPLSPHMSVMEMVGGAHIHIDYSSPRVRERVIFGGLVAYDKVWVSGAHMATWIETSKDLYIEGSILPKGKYGFFTIPGKDNWTIIFNKNWDQHGTDGYNPDEDVLRLVVKPEILQEMKEELIYVVTRTKDDSGSLSLEWGNVKVGFDFKVTV